MINNGRYMQNQKNTDNDWKNRYQWRVVMVIKKKKKKSLTLRMIRKRKVALILEKFLGYQPFSKLFRWSQSCYVWVIYLGSFGIFSATLDIFMSQHSTTKMVMLYLKLMVKKILMNILKLKLLVVTLKKWLSLHILLSRLYQL